MALSIFLFATSEFFEINLNNISTLLFRMADFIRNRKIHSKTEKDISIIVSFGQAAQNFVLSIYKVGWDALNTDNNNRSFLQCILAKFMLKNILGKPEKKTNSNNLIKSIEFSKIPSPVPLRLSKKVFEKSKFFKEKDKAPSMNSNTQNRQLYAQASSSSINEIIKIKKSFLSLSPKKI